MEFFPRCQATAIGSMPFIDGDEACTFIFGQLKEMPMWPQLSKRSWKESMTVQCSEGMPSLVVDEGEERIYFKTGNDVDLVAVVESFYSDYLNHDDERFSISAEYALGLDSFMRILAANDSISAPYLKGHVVGPITFGLSVTDQDRQAIFYNELLRDPVVKTLAMKAAWQARVFKRLRPEATPVIFFDEPYLQSFGSAYVSLGRSEAIDILNECFNAFEGISGVHCCGNTDWSLLMETEVDIINFDAFDYFDNIALYPKELKTFLDRGGVMAWGIVPSIYPDPTQVEREDVDSLLARFEDNLEKLVGLGISKDMVLAQSLVTPTCGTGSMTLELAKRSIELTAALSEKLRGRYWGEQ